jgi:nitrite reductase/ring-hydroxylating ferredoxin subunit
MSIGTLNDVTRVMDTLSPDQKASLDRWADGLQTLLRTAVDQGGPAARRFKNWLNGVGLGHPLHPALTDLTLGAWSTGALLDLTGARGPADAAITVGVLSAVPTALSGAADWSDTAEDARRTGLVHALLNSAGLVCMVGSLFARRNDQRALGIGLSTLGLGLASGSAWLGGHLVFALGTNVSRIAFEPKVAEFTRVARESDLEPGKLFGAEAEVDGQHVSVVLLKRAGSIEAISGTCSHWGGPLAEGKLVDGDCVECPWHASRFSMADGAVRQGPATVSQHAYEVRVREGYVEVRRRAA